jgi:hypothetical protein
MGINLSIVGTTSLFSLIILYIRGMIIDVLFFNNTFSTAVALKCP